MKKLVSVKGSSDSVGFAAGFPRLAVPGRIVTVFAAVCPPGSAAGYGSVT